MKMKCDRTVQWLFPIVCCIFASACSSSDHSQSTGPEPLNTLSEYGFFVGPMHELNPAEGVFPYTVNSPLWADNAEKGRFIVLPPETQITFSDTDDWVFPLGTTIIKTFYFDMDHTKDNGPYKIVETRLLVLYADGWKSHIYVWNEEETEAYRSVVGADVWLDLITADGTTVKQRYLVPNKNECGNCHERDDILLPLGLVARQMNTSIDHEGASVNQLALMESSNMFDGSLPASDSYPTLIDPYDPTGDLDWRARSWLDANCAHCHRPGSGGGSTGLDLRSTVTNPTKLGVCKSPVAAGSGTGGNTVDINPGNPDESILMYRISSLDPEIKMPELPNLQVDVQGEQLIREWILAMEPPGCNE